ncbi:MAG: hypothetical protein Q9219_007375 [cf. Caloplaca sp. 3 TL-2023]
MYSLGHLVLFALTLLHSVLVSSAPTPIDDVKTTELDRRASTITTVDQRLFKINGKTQYFAGKKPFAQITCFFSKEYTYQPPLAGANAWWLGHLYSNQDVDTALSQIAATGYKVLRVWAFGTTNTPSTTTDVYYQTLNASGQFFNYNTKNGIARLDYALAAAEQYGLKLILPLLNNWDELGGINTYTNVYGGTHQGFFTNAAAQAAYRKYIKFIVQRYRYSTAVFSWELCNEPRCSGCDTAVIAKWAADTSAYIKSLDGKHLVSLGDEGWLAPASSSSDLPGNDGSYAYSGYEGVDFERNLAIPTLDYGTFHLYPDHWGYGYAWGNTWIEQHNAVGKKLGKPVLLEEYGPPPAGGGQRVNVTGGWQGTVVGKTSVAGDLVWQFGTAFPSGVRPLDEYAVYYGSGEYGVLAVNHTKVMGGKKATAFL